MSQVLSSPELLEKCCREVEHLQGDAAEIGVWQGVGAKKILENVSEETTLHLFDTFTGMPKEKITPVVDLHEAGNFNDTSVGAVQKALANDLHRVVFHVGVFPNTAPEGLSLKFVHVDCDLYVTTGDALEWSWRSLVRGGVVLNDDYGFLPGARRAVDEFARRTPDAVLEVSGKRAILRRRK